MKWYLLIPFLFVLIGCTTEPASNQKEDEAPIISSSLPPWMIYFQQRVDTLEPIEIVINEYREEFDTPQEVDGYLEKLEMELPDADTMITHFEVAATSQITYLIQSLPSSTGLTYKRLAARYRESPEKPEDVDMLFLAPSNSTSFDSVGINRARDQWMQLCNAHDPTLLATQLYEEDALYFNHKPIIIGREAIIAEYQYMSHPAYALKLIPLHIEPVQEGLVWEIGQCSGSYGGKYIIIWHQANSGEWKVLMDSNV